MLEVLDFVPDPGGDLELELLSSDVHLLGQLADQRDQVAAGLAAAGCRVVVPYLRGYGPTRFLSPGTPRSGQQAALGNDYPLTQALLLVFALCPIVANFVMDLLNLVLDPRVRTA